MNCPLGPRPVASLGLPGSFPPRRYAQGREILSFRRKRGKIGTGWRRAMGTSERRQPSGLPRPAHQGFDRHAFVDVTHADRELHRGEFNRFGAGIFNLLPTDIAAPPVNFNMSLVLADERVFGEGCKRAVRQQLFPAINSLGALREDLDNQNRVFDFARLEIHRLAIARATHEQVGIIVSVRLRDSNPDIIHKRPTWGITQMRMQSRDQIYGNHVVLQRTAGHGKDFAVHVLVSHWASRFEAQILFCRDWAVFPNEHNRSPDFNVRYYATCSALLVTKLMANEDQR